MKLTSFLRFFRGILGIAVLSALLSPAMAQAADFLIDKSLSDLPTNVDLNDFTAWAYYADSSVAEFATPIDASPTTNAFNSATFSAIATVPANSNLSGDDEPTNMTVTYVGGVGGTNGAAQVGTGPHKTAGSNYYDFTVGSGLTLTTKLIAPTETLNFYLYAYYSTADLSLTLDSTTGSATDNLYTNEVLSPGLQGNSDANGDGNTQGELTVAVQGAIGDTLHFTFSPGTDGGHVGIQAVTVEAPEPSTYAMMLGGLALLGFCLRRKLA